MKKIILSIFLLLANPAFGGMDLRTKTALGAQVGQAVKNQNLEEARRLFPQLVTEYENLDENKDLNWIDTQIAKLETVQGFNYFEEQEKYEHPKAIKPEAKDSSRFLSYFGFNGNQTTTKTQEDFDFSQLTQSTVFAIQEKQTTESELEKLQKQQNELQTKQVELDRLSQEARAKSEENKKLEQVAANITKLLTQSDKAKKTIEEKRHQQEEKLKAQTIQIDQLRARLAEAEKQQKLLENSKKALK